MAEFRYIYVLVLPNSDQVFYVGQSANPQRRFLKHVSVAGFERRRKEMMNRKIVSGSQMKDVLIAGLKFVGLTPTLRVLEKIDESAATKREIYWIDHYSRLFPLMQSFGVRRKVSVNPVVADKWISAATGLLA